MAHRHGAVAVLMLMAMVTRPMGRVTSPPDLVWEVAGDGLGTPAVDRSSAYFLSRGQRYEIVAIDRASGRPRWRTALDVPSRDTIGSRVVTSRGVVVAGGYELDAFDAATGARLWRYGPSESYGFGFYLGPAEGGDVYSGSSSGELFAFDISRGRPRWILAVGGKDTTVYTPALERDDVVAGFVDFGEGGARGVVAVGRKAGQERWRRSLPVGRTGGRPPAVGGTPVLTEMAVVVSGKDGSVHALARSTGAVLWSWRDEEDEDVVEDFRPLAVSSGVVVAGSLSGKVTGLDLGTGRKLWSRQPSRASVAFALGWGPHSIYVPYVSGLLVALAASDGRERWRRGGIEASFRWAPVADGPYLFFAGRPAGFVSVRDPRDLEKG